jgi:ABC-type molybdate transport system substrate-binding protein
MHPFISKRLFLPILIATGLVFSVIAATAAEKVIIFHAGSLTVPLAKIEKATLKRPIPASISSARPGAAPKWPA